VAAGAWRGAGVEVKVTARPISFARAPSPIPLIWLDTSILLRLGRVKRGKGDRDGDSARVLFLRDNIYDLVRAECLICPEANQKTEYLSRSELFDDVVHGLSLGVRTVSPGTLQLRQEVAAMRAYLSGQAEIASSYMDLFQRDPLMVLKENLSKSLFITLVDRPSADRLEEVKRARRTIHKEWEELRQRLVATNIGYPSQLKIELVGEIRTALEGFARAGAKLNAGHELSDVEWKHYFHINELLTAWNALSPTETSIDDFFGFLRSNHYQSVPTIEVSAMLVAKLLTLPRVVDHGDAKDVEHLAMMLPYADVMIVDKEMKSLVRQLGLHKRFAARVLCIGDRQEVADFFDNARRRSDQRQEAS
jgi:hypothetical protein